MICQRKKSLSTHTFACFFEHGTDIVFSASENSVLRAVSEISGFAENFKNASSKLMIGSYISYLVSVHKG
jgi:hypothetical protein